VALFVNDGCFFSDLDYVTITAISELEELVRKLRRLLEEVGGLPANAFKKSSLKTALTDVLSDVLAQIEGGITPWPSRRWNTTS
jgi:hypothetical protein